MKRRLFNAGAVVSLVLCLIVTTLWLRSYWRIEGFTYWSPGFWMECKYHVGVVEIQWSGDTLDLSEFAWVSTRAGFQFYLKSLWEMKVSERWIEFPLWMPALFFALPPAAWWWKRRRSKMTEQACPACGYDLRGTLGSECPECGAERRIKGG